MDVEAHVVIAELGCLLMQFPGESHLSAERAHGGTAEAGPDGHTGHGTANVYTVPYQTTQTPIKENPVR